MPVLWLSFVLLGLAGGSHAQGTLGLAVLVLVLLLLPKLLVAATAGARVGRFGGWSLALASVVAETLQSSFVAPVLLMFQARSVLQVVMGRDGGWPAQTRGDGALGWADGWRAGWWITLWGLGLLLAAWSLAVHLLPWLLPLAGPMVLAPLIITWTSRPARSRLFTTPEELSVPTVIRRAATERARWSAPDRLPFLRSTAKAKQAHHA